MKNFAFYVIAACVAVANGQGTLNTFSRIRDALLEGSELQLNAYAPGCSTSWETNLIVSMPLRHWQHITTADRAEEIRADDAYVQTDNATSLTWLARTINIYDDESVLVTISIVGPDGTDQYTMECTLGVGAVAHRIIQGNDIQDVSEYNEVKSHLLLGDHVEAVGYLNLCDNAGDAFPDGSQFILGYNILRFDVVNDGTQDEFILIDDLAILSANGTTFYNGAEQVIIPRNGPASVKIAVFDNALNVVAKFDLTCNVGTALRFTVHSREAEDTYTTYPEIREATLAGHDMELVAFLGMCSVVEGEAVNTPGVIVSARADEFQLFKAGSFWGDQEYIAYSTWNLNVGGTLLVEIVRLYEDGTLLVEWYQTTPVTGEVRSGILNCPLQTASLFHAVSRNRRPITDYAAIIGDVLGRGQIFEIEVDYDRCQAGGFQLGSIFGGIAWETYIDPSPDTGFFYANEFALVTQNITGTRGLAWDASGIAVAPNGVVYIEARLYEFFSGVNLADQDFEITCRLGEGVTFFRYP